ncbi:MAG: hypothetical protein PHH49_08700 [Candidatus Omnitrophica bacterium]|nr:hypothetical protein [Candidatus Omnitrophota bacterium]MDD5489018.1 hypothetical protein [Candidatus Omnitrophota bacterium]
MKNRERVNRCAVCVLPENFPNVSFSPSGVCSLCQERVKDKGALARILKTEKKRLGDTINGLKGRSSYDVLLCYSGGKDSTYTLELLRRRYGLKVLAFTFDNGFLASGARRNIEVVTDALDVDHIWFKPSPRLLKGLFRRTMERNIFPPKAMERASAVCTSCIGLVKYTSLKTAIEKNIPMIAFGWSPGQAPPTSSVMRLSPMTLRFMEATIKEPIIKVCGKAAERFFLEKKSYTSKKVFPVFIHPLSAQPYDEKKIFASVRRIGWKMPKGVELNATNCRLNILADEEHIHKYGYHPYAAEIAYLVRSGYMTRSEGIKHLKREKNKKIVAALRKELRHGG